MNWDSDPEISDASASVDQAALSELNMRLFNEYLGNSKEWATCHVLAEM
jgi:hypothetical protein